MNPQAMIDRRRFIAGLFVAPAIVSASIIMPVQMLLPDPNRSILHDMRLSKWQVNGDEMTLAFEVKGQSMPVVQRVRVSNCAKRVSKGMEDERDYQLYKALHRAKLDAAYMVHDGDLAKAHKVSHFLDRDAPVITQVANIARHWV